MKSEGKGRVELPGHDGHLDMVLLVRARLARLLASASSSKSSVNASSVANQEQGREEEQEQEQYHGQGADKNKSEDGKGEGECGGQTRVPGLLREALAATRREIVRTCVGDGLTQHAALLRLPWSFRPLEVLAEDPVRASTQEQEQEQEQEHERQEDEEERKEKQQRLGTDAQALEADLARRLAQDAWEAWKLVTATLARSPSSAPTSSLPACSATAAELQAAFPFAVFERVLTKVHHHSWYGVSIVGALLIQLLNRSLRLACVLGPWEGEWCPRL